MAGPTYDTVAFPAPVSGEAPSLPPDQLAPTQAQALKNFLVHHPGRIIPRGGISGPVAGLDNGELHHPDGAALYSTLVSPTGLNVTFRGLSNVPQVDPARVPINRPTLASELSQPLLGNGVSRTVNLVTGAVTTAAVPNPEDIGGERICYTAHGTYVVSAGGPSTAVPSGVAQKTQIIKLEPTAVSLTNGPLFVQDVFFHYGRLWAAAARRPGGSDYDTSQIFYSNPDGTTALTNVVTDWQDPVTGELNRIEIGPGRDDFVVGFGRAAGHLLIFTRNTVWVLYGTSPANFTLRQIRAQNGCVDVRSIVVADEGTYFASQMGYELFDGSRFTLLSAPVSDIWLPLSNAGVAGTTVTHAFIRASALPNGYLYVAMGTDNPAAFAVDGTVRGWLVHRARGAWIDMPTGLAAGLLLGAGGYLQRITYSHGVVVGWGVARWARCENLTYGDVKDGGLADYFGATAHSVPLLWKSRVANIGGTWAATTLQRASVDYRQEYTAAAVSAPAWGTGVIQNGVGTALTAPWSLNGSLTPGPRRTRPVQAVRDESPSGDAAIQVESTLGATATQRHRRCDLHGASIGYRVGYERTAA